MNNKELITPAQEQIDALQESKLSLEKNDDDSKINNYIRQLLSIRKTTNGTSPIRK